MGKFDDPKRDVLHSIADALGVPVEQFYSDGPAPRTSTGEDDCLRLWSRIRTEEGRAQALEALQAIVDEEAI